MNAIIRPSSHDEWMERELDTSAFAWLDRQSPDGRATGSTPAGWECSVWIAHAMHETDALPGDVSWNDLKHHPELHAGLPPEAEITSGRGWSQTPNPGWRRVRWSELGRRRGVDPFAGLAVEYCFAYLDVHDVFAFDRSWPLNLDRPAEGSLDPEQYLRLIDNLCAVVGPDSTCFAYYSHMAVLRFTDGFDPFDPADEQLLFRGATPSWRRS